MSAPIYALINGNQLVLADGIVTVTPPSMPLATLQQLIRMAERHAKQSGHLTESDKS